MKYIFFLVLLVHCMCAGSSLSNSEMSFLITKLSAERSVHEAELEQILGSPIQSQLKREIAESQFPLHHCACWDDPASVELLPSLIESTGNINAKDNNGETALMALLRCDDKHTIESGERLLKKCFFLLKGGADGSIQDFSGTALHHAVSSPSRISLQLMRLLLIMQPALLNKYNTNGETPFLLLMHNYRNADEGLLRVKMDELIKAGADILACDMRGLNPLFAAIDTVNTSPVVRELAIHVVAKGRALVQAARMRASQRRKESLVKTLDDVLQGNVSYKKRAYPTEWDAALEELLQSV